ncbi:hypothetical protein C1645_873121 [Glomus cerebriforme]|uniref:Transmembrane protein n=1 Tax=Glomus cerebriforme TaxID=658196 RepID=A0A397TIZ0_9GLOM|nr:hypothetical protein C1645_873121 [Glomus cerebriforme]
MIKSSQIRILFINLLLLIQTQIAYSAPLSRNRSWVFWYYSNDGQNRNCANYCVLTFSIVGAIIILIILCGILSCYRIKKQALKDGRAPSYREFFTSQDSALNGIRRKGGKGEKDGKQHERSGTSGSMSDVYAGV